MTVIVAVDMFVVATATFRLLYAVIVLDHHRRRVVHFEVTQNPTQVWLAQQINEAFPWDTAPRYLLRDRDTSYGLRFQKRVRATGIEEVLTAPGSPWQSPYVERIWINGDIAEQETKFAAHWLATFILLVCVWPALLSTVLAMCFGSKLAASPR
jgi:hypothetical protein